VPTDDRYFQPDVETMPRADLDRLQEEKLLALLPYAYERSGIVRETWDGAGVHPRDIRSMADFVERAPFIDKDAIRSFRDRHKDPYGGLLCVPERELIAIYSTSGTTGDPTPTPQGESHGSALGREFWELGARPGDCMVMFLFTFRGVSVFRSMQDIGAVPLFFDHTPVELPRLAAASARYRPTGLYLLSGPLIMAIDAMAPSMGIDPRELFEPYRGAVYGGEPLGPRARQLVDEWGIELFLHTAVGDAGAATECGMHDGYHWWEDNVLVEHLSPDGADAVAGGARGEMVVTSLSDRVAPLVRFRTDDLVHVARGTCGCGRTHGRIWPLARKGDEVVVEGRSVIPTDVWAAVESVPATSSGFFQVIRPARELDRLRLRVGYREPLTSPLGPVRDAVADAVEVAVGLRPEVELVPEAELLKLGPPQKIPRVAKA
jgi:phenylacetate-CoA ligase